MANGGEFVIKCSQKQSGMDFMMAAGTFASSQITQMKLAHIFSGHASHSF